MAERRYLIVGGMGYFGARLAESLRADGAVVVTYRTLSPTRSEWLRASGCDAVAFDSSRTAGLPVEGRFDGIVNLATASAAEAAIDESAATDRAFHTLAACVRLLDDGRAERLIHFSTFHVYGGARDVYTETDSMAPLAPYGRVHRACEEKVGGDPRVTVVRPTNLVGAPAHADLGEQAKLLFLDLCRQATTGAIRLHNDGCSYRNFLPFADAIRALRLLLTTQLPHARVLNMAGGTSTRLDEVARLIAAEAGRGTAVVFGTGQDAFRTPFTVEVGRLKALGWEPTATLRDETARLLRVFR